MAVDPVCKKEVDETSPPAGKVRFWDKVFYFCAAGCRSEFRRRPLKYAPEVGEREQRGPGYDDLTLFRS